MGWDEVRFRSGRMLCWFGFGQGIRTLLIKVVCLTCVLGCFFSCWLPYPKREIESEPKGGLIKHSN